MRNVLLGFLLVASGVGDHASLTPIQSYSTEAKCKAQGESLEAQFSLKWRTVPWACIESSDE